ncbi:MAG: toprim domain-containing protein [Clostridiales bacterium]
MDNKEIIKNNLSRILVYYGAKPGVHNWQCIPGRHKTPNFDLSVKNGLCCCHCGIEGDSISVIGFLENLDTKKDFPEIIRKGMEILNNQTSVRNYRGLKKKRIDLNNKKNPSTIINLTKIISQEFKKAKKREYLYFYSRGITNIGLFRKYKFLVRNPEKILPKELLPNLYNIYAYEYIIPVWESGEVVNLILRRNDKKSIKNKKILNLKNLKLTIFNIDYLKEPHECLFLTEGVFDALSFENEGYKAIALNSISMKNRFIDSVKENITNLENTIFFVSLDADKYGKAAAKKIIDELKGLGLKAFNLSIKNGYKDINEYYVKNKKAFKVSLNWIERNIINGRYK